MKASSIARPFPQRVRLWITPKWYWKLKLKKLDRRVVSHPKVYKKEIKNFFSTNRACISHGTKQQVIIQYEALRRFYKRLPQRPEKEIVQAQINSLFQQLKPTEEFIKKLQKDDPELSNYLKVNNQLEEIKQNIENQLMTVISLHSMEISCNQLQEELQFHFQQLQDACSNFYLVMTACKKCEQDIQAGRQIPSKESPYMSTARRGLRGLDQQYEEIDEKIKQLLVQIVRQKKLGLDTQQLEKKLARFRLTFLQIQTISNRASFWIMKYKQNLTGHILVYFHKNITRLILGYQAQRFSNKKAPRILVVMNIEQLKSLKEEYQTFRNIFDSMNSKNTHTLDSKPTDLYQFWPFIAGNRHYKNFKKLFGHSSSNSHHLTYEECEILLSKYKKENISLRENEVKLFANYQAFLYHEKSLKNFKLPHELDSVQDKLIVTAHCDKGLDTMNDEAGNKLSSQKMVEKSKKMQLPKTFRYLKFNGCEARFFAKNAAKNFHLAGYCNLIFIAYEFLGLLRPTDASFKSPLGYSYLRLRKTKNGTYLFYPASTRRWKHIHSSITQMTEIIKA